METNSSVPAHQIRSMVCRQAHFETPWYRFWDEKLGLSARKVVGLPSHIVCHRKFWEWAAIAQALYEREMLAPGRHALGFAVGTEPLASLFASFGVDVLGTDLSSEDPSAQSWRSDHQHAANLSALHFPHLVPAETFETQVRFQPADMRDLSGFQKGSFDFVWSSCAMEHLGSLQAGIRFVLESSELLKLGGIAAHTTEFNVASLEHTLELKDSVIYLRNHIESLDHELRKTGRCLAKLDFFAGDGEHDRRFDRPPYYQTGNQHIKMQLEGHITTSMTLIVLG